jgi:hypothetical protein
MRVREVRVTETVSAPPALSRQLSKGREQCGNARTVEEITQLSRRSCVSSGTPAICPRAPGVRQSDSLNIRRDHFTSPRTPNSRRSRTGVTLSRDGWQPSVSNEAVDPGSSRTPRRTERRDPRLPLADMFDPIIAQRLWESLPEECRVDHIDRKSIPEVYRGAIKLVSSGARPVKKETAPWTSCSLNFRDLPEPMAKEIAWLLHREIELGRYIHPNMFNAAIRVLRVATQHGTKRGRSAADRRHRSLRADPTRQTRRSSPTQRLVHSRRNSCATRGTPASHAPSWSQTPPTRPNCAANSTPPSAWS